MVGAAVVWGAAVAMVTMPICGWLGDKVGQRRMFALGTVDLMIFAPVFFHLLQTRDPAWITLAMVISIGIVYSMLMGQKGHCSQPNLNLRCATQGFRLAYKYRARSVEDLRL